MKTRKKLSPAAKRRGWAQYVIFMLSLSLILFLGGFVVFAETVRNLRPPNTLNKADGIVIWTGKGGGRLETGADLLRRGKGERLLISGVNEQTSLEAIKSLIILPDKKADCCIDLDYAAQDTIGNARETASWAQALGYEHIILVTSAYHMPRAEIEIGQTAGRIKITPYPVVNRDGPKWWSDKDRFKRILQEYTKLLLTYLRGSSEKSRQDPPPLDPLPEPEPETEVVTP